MAHPLELSYRWQTPVIVATVGAIVLTTLLVGSTTTGRGAVVAVVLALWAFFVVVVWLRTRAYLMVDGPTLTVRRYRTRHVVDGAQVRRVREYLTGHGPCYRLYLAGATRPVHVPAALLRAGHSTFFGWLQTAAPQAELDRRSETTRRRLLERGLLG